MPPTIFLNVQFRRTAISWKCLAGNQARNGVLTTPSNFLFPEYIRHYGDRVPPLQYPATWFKISSILLRADVHLKVNDVIPREYGSFFPRFVGLEP